MIKIEILSSLTVLYFCIVSLIQGQCYVDLLLLGRILGVGAGGAHPPPSLRWPAVFQYKWYSAKKKNMWFIGVEVERKTSAPPPKKNAGSAPVLYIRFK